MNRSQLTQDMKTDVGASWCTRQELASYLGYKDVHSVDRFLYGCTRIGNKYPIAEIVDALLLESIKEEKGRAVKGR